jgi:Transposase IS66 family
LLRTDQAALHDEKNALLAVGLEVSRSITVDDSGARHQGKNGYVTQIGNEFFAWFASTGSKSRINFLECLHAGETTYGINDAALRYMTEQGLSEAVRQRLYDATLAEIGSPKNWQRHLDALEIEDERHVRIATEGALLGRLLDKGFNPELAIISDGAGQFAILLHGLCWIHAERLIHKLIPVNDLQREAVAKVRDQIWCLYADLKAYKTQPDATRIDEFESRFSAIFTQRTDYATLNRILHRLHQHKDELLLVLRRPDIPLHTNGSETDIRDYVKKRKVSGGTRSDLGRQCRDTFASLKKTCRKLGVSFWQYLIDRLSLTNIIPPLPTLVRKAATGASVP